jgi:hypothetical protein
MKPDKKDNTFLYIGSTIAFVLLGVILTSVINSTKPTTNTLVKASATAGVSAIGVVSEVNQDKGTITIDQLAYASSPTRKMGSWVVTPPSTFKLNSVIVGNSVALTIDPVTFSIPNHTFTAKDIKKK